MEKKDETPVILITYNRPLHTRLVLNSLKSHNRKNIYIFSDGPKNNIDSAKVEETRALFKNIDWCKPKIIEREKNLGLAMSIVGAVNHVLKRHDRLILLEDDCVPQKYFFDFVETCLDKYENNEEIFGISGYTVPVPENIRKKYPNDLYIFPRIGSWGWATWKRAWQHFEPDPAKAYEKAVEKNIDLSQGGNDIPLMLNNLLNGRIKDVWTLGWVVSVYLNNGYYIYPTLSHLDNIGMDGSGVHCGATRKFITPPAEKRPSRYPDEISVNMDIYKNFRKYYDISPPVIQKHKLNPKTNKSLKVVNLCTLDSGGAGKAAYRLNKGLEKSGLQSNMLVLNKLTGDPSVKVLPQQDLYNLEKCLEVQTYSSQIWVQQLNKWQNLLSNYPDRPAGLEMFSDAEATIRLDLIKEIKEADIINLHWVAGQMDYAKAPMTFGEKPIVWTLHDMNPFTGGCHYAGDCLKYKTSCGACPQLGSNNENDLARHVWKQKYNAYQHLNLNIVTPSRWLAQCAAESALLSRFQVTVIPNGFPTDIFNPYPKKEVRRALNVPESSKIILFGSVSVANERKGFKYLLNALNKFSINDKRENIVLAFFGYLPKEVKINSKYPVLNLGPIADEKKLAMAYSAADLLVIPSIEDNLPNIVVEAMACGVPVVGFDIGGIPDMIDHKKTGYIVKPRDIDGLIEGINWVMTSIEGSSGLNKNCRAKAENEYSLQVQARAYVDLYGQILKNKENEIGKTPIGSYERRNDEIIYEYILGQIRGMSRAQAISELNRFLKEYPEYARAHNDIAVLYDNEGNKEKAQRHYEKAATLAPDSSIFQKNMANFYYRELGRIKEALQLYDKVLDENPDDLETLLGMGRIAYELEKPGLAVAFYNRVLAIDPDNANAIEEFRHVRNMCA